MLFLQGFVVATCKINRKIISCNVKCWFTSADYPHNQELPLQTFKVNHVLFTLHFYEWISVWAYSTFRRGILTFLDSYGTFYGFALLHPQVAYPLLFGLMFGINKDTRANGLLPYLITEPWAFTNLAKGVIYIWDAHTSSLLCWKWKRFPQSWSWPCWASLRPITSKLRAQMSLYWPTNPLKTPLSFWCRGLLGNCCSNWKIKARNRDFPSGMSKECLQFSSKFRIIGFLFACFIPLLAKCC